LATIAVLCMGLFAPPAAFASGRFGSRHAIAGCLGLIFAFGLARVLVGSAALVILLTVPVGIGMGLANALLPVAVKENFAYRPAFATGVYATGINLGSAVASAVAVPVAHSFGGWRAALGSFSGFTGLLVVAWLVLSRGEPSHVRTGVRPVRLPFHSATAWRLAITFGLLSVTFYGLNSWLPDAYVEPGWSEART